MPARRQGMTQDGTLGNKSLLSTAHRDAFIVRIWREEGKPEWRGWVQHVRTGDSVSVQSLDELVTFIERRTGKLTDPSRRGLK
jgi:hypothetical protein